jgi:hypothetical protein
MSSRVQFRRAGTLLQAVTFLSLILMGALRPPAAPAQLSATNSVVFFTNVTDRLLRAYTTEWLSADYANYTNTFKVDQPFGVTGIPVYVNGQMAYASAVHRVLQVAANIWDAKTNRYDAFGPLPTVFAPRFTVSNNAVYITGYAEVQTTNDLSSLPALDLTLISSNNLAAVVQPDSLIYGVPLVIGARKGLPNFNEYAMDTTFTVGRQLELRKSAPGGQSLIYQTNQFYTLNVAVQCGTEFWNSYRSNYTRPVNITANNRMTISLTDSNSPSGTPVLKTVVFGGNINYTAGAPWLAWSGAEADSSFVVPFRTNITLFTPATVAYQPGSGVFTNPAGTNYEVDARLLLPNWRLVITNRVQATITDQATGRIIDYVLLGDMTYRTNLVTMFGQSPTSLGFTGTWATNLIGSQISGRLGIVQQILVSMGNASVFGSSQLSDWATAYGTFPPNRAYEIAKFGAFFLPFGATGIFTDPVTGEQVAASNTNLIAYAPFNPLVAFTIPMSWQANDSLVHYIGRDMLELKSSGIPYRIKLTDNNNTNAMANIGFKNLRYQPWAKDSGALANDPDAFNPAIKDPLVRGSDDWQFPTNTLLTFGWIGRIHRGTPWQTIYLKSSNLGITNLVSSPTAWALNANFKTAANKWAKWTGNRSLQEGFYSRPVSDWLATTLLQELINTNPPQQLLSINNPNTNAWLDVLDGLSVMTNILSHGQLLANTPAQFDSLTIASNSIQAGSVVASIFVTRANQNSGVFRSLGELLAASALSLASPWLNQTTDAQLQRGLTDEAYECLPAQLLSLVRTDSIGAISQIGGSWQIQFTGTDGYAYAVECSTNLINWTVVSSHYPTNGVFTITDGSAGAGQRYYRSVLQP